MFYKHCESQHLRATDRAWREFSLCVLPGFQHHHWEKPLKEMLEMMPANEPSRDSPGMLWLAGMPCVPTLQAGSPSLPVESR